MTGRVVLVTGAGGFVCSEVALALAAAGYEVVVTDQKFDAATAARLSGLRMIAGQLDGALSLLSDITPFGVIHGAAITASPERLGLSNAGHVRRNMELLTETLDWARTAGAQRFIFLSSMGVFEPGDLPKLDGQFTERTQPSGIIPYCAAKRAGEIVTAGAADADFATLNLRLGNVFGPHEAVRPTRQMLCLVSRMKQAARDTGVIRVDSPDTRREWAWLPDLATGIAALLGQFPDADLLHAGTPPTISDGDLATAIASRMPGVRVERSINTETGMRPPMGSVVQSVMDDIRWTELPEALDLLLATEAAQ